MLDTIFKLTERTKEMEKYRLIGEKKSDSSVQESDDVCEVKITQQGKPKNYISYAMNLFVSATIDKYQFCRCVVSIRILNSRNLLLLYIFIPFSYVVSRRQ